MLKKMIVCLAMLAVMFFIFSCDSEGSNGENNDYGSDTKDIYDGLKTVSTGEIKCNGDNCCVGRCGQNDVICVTRDPEVIAKNLSELECDSMVFPDWFYQYNCYLLFDEFGSTKVSSPKDDGTPRIYSFVECVCGRSGDKIASDYSFTGYFEFYGCSKPLVWTGKGDDESLAMVDEKLTKCGTSDDPYRCGACKPYCGTRECGSDGCGGSCGTCVIGKECSAAGICSTKPDTCSSCLSSCRGMPSCCTGCGCICESDCGGCFLN